MAGIVFGCAVPHPPIIIPDIGRGEESAISDTTRAMEELCDILAEQHPETVLIISPHGDYHADAMGVLAARSSTGDMHRWGARGPELHFDNDLKMVELIIKEAKADNIPIKPMGNDHYSLDHGIMVPMHFLYRGITGLPLVPLSFCWLPLETHFTFGKAIKRAAEQSQKRVALIASGDLSHRLIPTAPAGYDPMGKVFDEKLVNALSYLSTEEIVHMDRDIIERAGECGLRPITVLLGAMDGLQVTPRVLSYQGPFGVGYLVASFEIAP